jgi:hypothetical protein
VQLVLTLALALTETLMLADAVSEALAAVPAHARALPPNLVEASTTACPVAATFSRALFASCPFVLKVSKIAGKLASTVAFSFARSPSGSRLKTREIVCGVQVIFAEACALQLD